MIAPADPSGLDGADDGALADLVEEVTERLHAGEPFDPAEVARRYPDHAPRLWALLPALEALAGAAAPPPRPAPAASGPPAAGPGVIGDFRIIREIGRGGMGVVYEAEQISLGRRVALKVLPFAAALNARQLQRFKTEAQAAAQLHHTHIVPVYAVGCERGIHYYAMQFIDGQTLAAVIDRLRDGGSFSAPIRDASQRRSSTARCEHPTLVADPSRSDRCRTTQRACAATTRRSGPADREFFRTVAGWGAQAAEALDYAHQLGVVHRDVKPANLLVDAAGKLWVADFGLARCGHEAGPTVTGEVLGTLRYMSPEQASARRGVVDHRTDVYALGVTLYELLTLEPVFAGGDPRELLAQVVGAEVRPLRRLNCAVPPELETVVHKALAKDPAERYATAQELADDLRRFLDDRPVQARRPTAAERLARWCRRRRKLVGAAAAASLAAAVVLATATALVVRQRDEAERGRAQARQAVDAMYTEVAERLLAHQPHQGPLERSFLRQALRFYEEFARESGGDRGVRLEAGRAALRVADLRRALGEHDGADTAYATALERFRGLAAEAPDWPDARAEWAVALNHRGHLRRTLGQARAAEQDYRQARALFARLADEPAAAPAHRDGLAGSEVNLGLVLHAAGRTADAEDCFRRAAELLRQLVAEDPAAPNPRHDLATCENNLGTLLRDTGRPAEAGRAFDRAVALWQPLADEFPGYPAYRRGRATGLANAAWLRAAAGQSAEAERLYGTALAIQDRLAADFPQVDVYRQEAAATQHALGVCRAAEGRAAEAEEALCRAYARRQALVEEHPNVPAYRRDLGASHHALGGLLAAAGRWSAAEPAYRAALLLRADLADECPDELHYKLELAQTEHRLAAVLAVRGQGGEAEALFRRAAQRLADRSGAAGDPTWCEALTAVEADLGRLLRAADRTAR